MSDEIISSESEATVNNQNPSTPSSSACPLSSVKGTTHIDSHCHIIITTNSAKRVKVDLHRTFNEPENNSDSKLNLGSSFKRSWWTEIPFVGPLIPLSVDLWILVKKRADRSSPLCLHAHA